MYKNEPKLVKLVDGESTLVEPKSITRIFDNASIPFDPDNTDYQAYLKWLDEGNTPQPADSGE
jgi:hypothetical protein